MPSDSKPLPPPSGVSETQRSSKRKSLPPSPHLRSIPLLRRSIRKPNKPRRLSKAQRRAAEWEVSDPQPLGTRRPRAVRMTLHVELPTGGAPAVTVVDARAANPDVIEILD